MEVKSLLKKLLEVHGAAGFEDDVASIIAEELRDYVDEMEIDSFGNLIAIRRGKVADAPKIMICAHMDEVGMMVKYIDPDGFIYFEEHGILDDRILPTQWVRIHTRKGPIIGAIGVKARHLLTPEEMAKPPTFRNMWVDIGAESRRDAEEMGVKPGDPITFDRGFRIIGKGGLVLSRALDDRLGCTVLIQSIKELAQQEHEATVYAVASAQEEVGSRGSKVAAFRIKPDVALCLDCSYGTDPAVKPNWSAVRVGAGPSIRSMDIMWSAFQGFTSRAWIRDLMIETAEEEHIPYQIDVVSMAGFSDATSMSQSRGGVPTIGILIVRRNSHSPAEIASLNDVENAIRLTVAFTKKITIERLSQIKKKLK